MRSRTNPPATPRKKWGLVLSGGAAFGLANIGVLQALEAEKLTPDVIAGSSMGAIVAAVVAMGHSTERCMDLLHTVRSWNVATLAKKPLQHGLHGGILQQSLRKYLEPLLGSAVIGDCRIPFCCVAGRVKKPVEWHRIIQKDFTDHVLDSIEKHVFGPEVPIIDALMASSAIPILFSPVEIDGSQYVDLVHFGAIPSRSLIDLYHPDVVIATQTDPSFNHILWMLPAGWKEFYERGKDEQQQSKDACDLIMKPDLSGLQPYEFGRGELFAERGRASAIKSMKKLKTLIEK